MQYKKKPVIVNALKFYDLESGARILEWVALNSGHASLSCGDVPKLVIHTLEGTMEATVGDWVIRGVAGEFYPCKPAIFDATYDEVEEYNDD